MGKKTRTGLKRTGYILRKGQGEEERTGRNKNTVYLEHTTRSQPKKWVEKVRDINTHVYDEEVGID